LYAESLLEIDLGILLRKTGARLNFKIALVSLHIHPKAMQVNYSNHFLYLTMFIVNAPVGRLKILAGTAEGNLRMGIVCIEIVSVEEYFDDCLLNVY
jgi:hypothetical protein